jgi:hypothetical protein
MSEVDLRLSSRRRWRSERIRPDGGSDGVNTMKGDETL